MLPEADAPEIRLLLAGDTHGNAGWLETLFAHATALDCCALVQLGDFGFWAHTRDGQRFLRRVEFLAKRAQVPLVWIDGNHENHTLLRERPAREDGFVELSSHVLYAPRGHRWTWSGKTFGALGGAFSIDWHWRVREVSWWPQEVVVPEDVAKLGNEHLDVLLTHDSPAGVPLAGFELPTADELRAYDSRRQIATAVENTNPRLLLHGHWHYRYGTTLRHIDRPATEQGNETVWADTRIEAFASDQEHDGSAWGVLELPSLRVTDGTELSRPAD